MLEDLKVCYGLGKVVINTTKRYPLKAFKESSDHKQKFLHLRHLLIMVSLVLNDSKGEYKGADS